MTALKRPAVKDFCFEAVSVSSRGLVGLFWKKVRYLLPNSKSSVDSCQICLFQQVLNIEYSYKMADSHVSGSSSDLISESFNTGSCLINDCVPGVEHLQLKGERLIWGDDLDYLKKKDYSNGENGHHPAAQRRRSKPRCQVDTYMVSW